MNNVNSKRISTVLVGIEECSIRGLNKPTP
jgi:hypothetical protein